ncbi:Interferon-inducible double-stranded RNA-dependent protein kinase activator A like A, partial [Pseudolycoriella hygida]
MGAGKSKKEAKHAAAKSLIDKMTGASFNENNTSSANGNMDANNSSMGNPIGWLQELCMARRWPPPTYETELEVGLPHERQFTIACVVLKHREIGQGKSKKSAKRLAANKMWMKLQASPLDQGQINQVLDEDGNVEIRVVNILNRYSDLKDVRVPVLTTQHAGKVSQFHKSLKARFGKTLADLQTSCLNEKDINFVQFLQEIANEHQFEITYVDIEEKTYNGHCQCLVQLSTLPIASFSIRETHNRHYSISECFGYLAWQMATSELLKDKDLEQPLPVLQELHHTYNKIKNPDRMSISESTYPHIICLHCLSLIQQNLCKEQYVHVFVMNSKGIFPTMSHKVPDSVITGLYRLTPNRYIVCTMGGTIQDLTIEKDLNITAQEIECGVHFDKYSLNGILISNNQAYWALALYSRQPSDQFVLRQPTIISFCATSAAGLLGKLLSNESLCLTNYYDCAEMMRLIELTRGDLPDEYYQGNANPNETIDNYLYQLKIRLILCYARRVYFERQGRQVESDYLCYEFKYIQKMILAITYYKRLKHLISIENFNEMLPFQQLAGKTWRAHLYAYLEEETVLQDYIDARNTLKINFDILLAETAGFDTFPSEFCLHCDKEIEVNTLECPDQHEIPRCCVTLLQVPLGNRRVCRQCHAVALGQYVHIFVMNSKGDLPVISHRVPNLFITGLYRLTPNRYIVCTMGGTIQDLTVEKDLKITAQEIKCNVHFDKYSLNGILISNNQAYWALALYPRLPTDHLALRRPTIISFCTTSANEIMDKLLRNESLCLSNYYDCVEMIRLIEHRRGDLPEEYYKGNADRVETTDNYLYQLKIRSIACYARSAFYKRKTLTKDSNYLWHEFEYIRKMILAITYYKRLRYLMNIENFNDLLPFQKLAGKSWRAYLNTFLEEDTGLKEYLLARNTLKINFDILLAETAGFDTFPSEFCLYCEKEIEVNKLACPDKHEIPRCCVTLLQVPLDNRRVCRQCDAVALDDISKLQEATRMKMEQFYCPLCDIALELNNSVLVENIQR